MKYNIIYDIHMINWNNEQSYNIQNVNLTYNSKNVHIHHKLYYSFCYFYFHKYSCILIILTSICTFNILDTNSLIVLLLSFFKHFYRQIIFLSTIKLTKNCTIKWKWKKNRKRKRKEEHWPTDHTRSNFLHRSQKIMISPTFYIYLKSLRSYLTDCAYFFLFLES